MASQLDPELALLRHQDNRVNQSTERFRGFRACVLALERRREFLDFRPVEVGHARVQQGRWLIRGLELLRQYLLAVTDRHQLVFDLGARHAALHARLPVLHIEAHGDYDGIGVSDEEGFTFHELMEELIPLNTLTELRPIVVMSACLGMWAVKMLQPVTRAACLAVIGPNRKLDDHELARGLQTFYRTMFQVGNGNTAYKAMNDAVDPTKPTFGMANAEMLFRMVYRHFLRDRCSPTELDKRAESIMHGIRWKYFIDHGKPMPMPVFEHFRTATRQHVESHDEHFDRFRREYFMLDSVPRERPTLPHHARRLSQGRSRGVALGSPAMDNQLVLGKVHIVEWLNEDDRRTGHEVFQEIEPLGKASNPPVEVLYHPIATAGELLGLLHALAEEYRRDRRTPLLHRAASRRTHRGAARRAGIVGRGRSSAPASADACGES